MIRDELLALAEELESCGPDCDECPAFEQAECRGYRECTENVARYCARRIREMAGHDACEVTTVSAYDLLSDEDREALAWVREMGGVEAAKERMMPEGFEWPRFEDGGLVEFGDGNCVAFERGETAKRIVLAADGEPLEVGQTVYAPHYDYVRCTVLAIEWVVDGYLVEVENEGGHKFRQTPDEFIHQRPVLDADGVPIREGDTLWRVNGDGPFTAIEYKKAWMRVKSEDGHVVGYWPDDLTHAKPDLDTWERIEEDARGLDSGVDIDLFSHTHEDLVRRCRALAERGE